MSTVQESSLAPAAIQPTRTVRLEAAINLVLSLLVAIGAFGVVSVAARSLTPLLLGVFLLVRRTADPVASLLQLGTVYTLRRRIAMARLVAEQYFVTVVGLAILSIVIAVVGVIGVAFGDRMGPWLFGNVPDARTLGSWFVVLVISQLLHYYASSLLFACRRIVWSNALQFLNAAGWYAIGFAYWRGRTEVPSLIALQACAVTAASLIAIAMQTLELRRTSGAPAFPVSRLRDYLADFAYYGAPRCVSPFVELGFYVVGPWLLRDNPETAGHLILALTTLRAAQIAVQPVSNVLGLAAVRRNDNVTAANGTLNTMLFCMLLSGAVLTATLYSWMPILLRLWLREPALVAATLPYAHAVTLALTPFLVFQGLKEPIDLLWHFPRNLVTLLLSSIVLAAIVLAGRSFEWPIVPVIVVAHVVALFLMGLVTIATCRTRLASPARFGLFQMLLLALGLAGLNAGIVRAVGTTGPVASVTMLGALALSGAMALAFVYRLEIPAAAPLRAILRRKSVA